MKISDKQIVNWLEQNISDIQVCKSYEKPNGMFTSSPPRHQLVFQRKIRIGRAGQNIWSEREYSSLREMATDAITNT